jgi:hypothetical protein
MIPAPLVRALDNETRRKVIAGGISASLIAVSLVAGLGVISGVFWGNNRSNSQYFTINVTVPNSFADYVPYDEGFTPNAPAYSLGTGLSNVVNIDDFYYLTSAQRLMLENNGFVVSPQPYYKQVYEILDANRHANYPQFITSDSVLHAFHVLYDLALREAEVYSFWDLLRALTLSMLSDSYAQYQIAPEGRWKDAALRNVAYFAVAAYLIDDTTVVPSEVSSEVSQVLSLIANHSRISHDWFMGYDEDFSQYVPRGHYTRSTLLGQYFKAMMWYGHVSFRLGTEQAWDQTPQAILISLALTNHVLGLQNPLTGYQAWDAIYEPTVFFVGAADDLLPTDYLELIKSIYGPTVTLQDLDNDTTLGAFINAARQLRSPLIMGDPDGSAQDMNATMAMRFMGQRYIPDSYILGQLVYTNVGTEENPRLMPKGLDVMAALGSESAWAYLDDQKGYYGYVEQMENVREMVGNISWQEWTHNLYYLWLYSLLPLLSITGDGYPLFMNNDAWADKQLNTALGSWTELRHDTILYAKQSGTTNTGMPRESIVAGYVEPVPSLYARLASLCKMMIAGLEARNLLSDDIAQKLGTLLDFLLGLKSISVKELFGESLNTTDTDLIRSSYLILQNVTQVPTDTAYTSDADRIMSLIADVHTDPNTMMVLEEAIGNPMFIYVAIPVDGEVFLARGGVFSYYEFQQPLSDRLTDEAWQDMLSTGSTPGLPSWTSSFVASGTTLSGLQLAVTVVPRPRE